MSDKITESHRLELAALMRTNDTIKGPSMIHKRLHEHLYRPMVDAGFVDWGRPPNGASDDFAGTMITQKGREFLAREARP